MGSNQDRYSIDHLLGQTYNRLTILRLDRVESYTQTNGSRQSLKYVECLCTCGASIVCRLGDVKSGRTTSCGCAKKGNYRTDLAGKRFERLLVQHRADGNSKWSCLCDCGKTHVVYSSHLLNGSIRSCGCLRDEMTSARTIAYLKSVRISMGIDPEKTITSSNLIQRSNFNKLAKEIVARDSYCCVWCNDDTSKLSVHHIETWFLNEDLRFNPTNLITLCPSCHKSVHNHGYHQPPDPLKSILMSGYSSNIREYLDSKYEASYAL